MKSLTFSQLRNQAKKYFDAVERGETLEVYRNGKPVAIITPVRSNAKSYWQSVQPLERRGMRLSRTILTERSES